MQLIILLIISLASYVLTVPTINQVSFNYSRTSAPLYTSGDTAIKDAYIVILKKEVTENQMINHLSRINAFISHHRRTNSNNSLHDQDIQYVYNVTSLKEEDSVVHTTELQHNAPWGLARRSSRRSLNFLTVDKYHYSSEFTGKDIKIYVIGTGISLDHVDFEGRVIWGTTVPSKETDVDGNGHGTYCSGIITGKRFGVAKEARTVAVKVLKFNGAGTMGDVIKGIEGVIHDYSNEKQLARTQNKSIKGAVANMNLGGRKSPTLNLAVDEAVNRGIVFSVAAGATDINDGKDSFSNFRRCVNLFAPGVAIKSAWTSYPRAIKIISGTSMDSSHVAVLATYFLSKERRPPKEIKDQIIRLATDDSLSLFPNDTPNL